MKLFRYGKPGTVILALLAMLSLSISAFAGGKTATYEVTITNITRGQTFTPFMVATHTGKFSLFTLGQPASAGLTRIAEGGNITPLSDFLKNNNLALDVQTNGGLLEPGKSVTVTVKANVAARWLSVVAMLIPTNDGFVALNRVRLPVYSSARIAYAYDAGTEPNDELCVNIPGPYCQGTGDSPSQDGEGYVHIHSGIHGGGDLKRSRFDWRNPVAKVVIRRVK